MLRLSVPDWTEASAALRSTTAAVVLVDADSVTYGDGTSKFLRRLESVPSVAIVSGACDASALALLATVSLGFVTDDVTVTVAADTVLALGLTSTLPAAIGLAPARGLLFGGTLDATALRDSRLTQVGDPLKAAERLAQPGNALLVRSLRIAARSTAAQARDYDTELRRIG